MQQQSGNSGLAVTYNEDLTELIDYVKARSYAKLVWHMTWAYQQDSTHSSFPNYDRDRVYMSHVRKLIQWYNILMSAGITEFAPEEPEASGEEA